MSRYLRAPQQMTNSLPISERNIWHQSFTAKILYCKHKIGIGVFLPTYLPTYLHMCRTVILFPYGQCSVINYINASEQLSRNAYYILELHLPKLYGKAFFPMITNQVDASKTKLGH